MPRLLTFAGKTGQGRAVCGGRSPASSGVVLCHGMLSSQVAIRLAAAPVCCSTMLDWLSGSLAEAERALECIWFQGLSQGLEVPHHLRKDSKPQGMQCGW